jgi:AcrR family transcriptional regulator
MQSELPQESRSVDHRTVDHRTVDRRVQRSRAALMGAAVHLVSERGTTAIPVTDLAQAANVSRQLVYLQFGDRDSLLVEAAIDLLQREYLSQSGGAGDNRQQLLLTNQVFARNRSFYRAMLTGTCSYTIKRALSEFFLVTSTNYVRTLFGTLDEKMAESLTVFFMGGTGTVIDSWLLDGAEPLDPEEVTERLLRIGLILAGAESADAEAT